MKKLFSSLILILVMAAAALQPAPAAAAQSSEPGVFTFTDLGLKEDMVLRGPYDSRAIRFDLPATWALQAGSELEIVATAFVSGSDALVEQDEIGALLEVSFNDKLQESIPLVLGEKVVYRVAIDAANLVSPYGGGSHKISFFLDAAIDCTYEFHETTVIIDVNSKANFPHGETTLSLDLQRLPWPIYLERGTFDEPVTVVLPASPTAEELQAGFVVMGAFGRMTGGKIALNSMTADQLTDAVTSQSHLLLVGKPAAFPQLSGASLPVGLTVDQFNAADLKAEDGVVQMLVSPWNASRVILLVSGNTDQAVVKAAQALSTGNLQTGATPNYSIVAQVNPFPSEGVRGPAAAAVVSDDISFADLGYSFIEVTGIGTHWVTYEFMVPAGQIPSGEVYLDLSLAASNQVNPDRSEAVVYVNDVQIGNLELTSDVSNLVTSRIFIPASTIRSGINRLDLVFNLIPLDACTLTAFSGLWVNIFPDSTLHLPLEAAPDSAASFTLRDLKAYPAPFTSDPSLSTTTFVVSPQDPSSWLLAARIAYDLGTRATNPVLGYHVAFDGQIPDELKTNHLIVVGEPRNLSILSDMKTAMPAYFESGSNVAVLESLQVIYRISAQKSLGYLQLYNSPWNDQAAILGVFGTTRDGLGYAVSSILDALTRGTLAGNFATLEGLNATVVDTRTGLGIGRFAPSLGPVVTQEDIPVPTQAPLAAAARYETGRQMTLYAILGVLALIVLTLIVVGLMRLRRRRA